MRKRAKVQDKLEKLSVADALHAVDFAEVVVLLLDATKGLEAQDLRIADKVVEEGRALIVALGKWDVARSEEHTSELQSLMRISYAVFCLKKKKQTKGESTIS